jgi:hypothetical protein
VAVEGDPTQGLAPLRSPRVVMKVRSVGGELRSIVAELGGKGVAFERCEMEGADFADGIHWFSDFGAACFKDPDGNILHLSSGD